MTQFAYLPEILPLTSFFAAVAGLWVLLRSGLAGRLAIDLPNERSLHVKPIPRTGGMVLVPAFLLAWLLPPDKPFLLALLVAVLALFSYLDDRAGLSAALRLGLHLLAAMLFVVWQLDLHDLVWMIATVFWIGWCTNLYNFMDGSDGLAGGMALSGFGVLGWAAASAGDQGLSLVCYSVAAASAGFLLFNFHPAKIFLGDAGSIPLGFLMGALGLLGWQGLMWPLWFPVLVFSPFIVDATVTLMRRLLRGDRVWQAHREHYYQRLVQMGWSHRRLALSEYALMLATGLTGIYMLKLDWPGQFAGLLLWVSLYAVAMITIDIHWKRHLKIAGAA